MRTPSLAALAVATLLGACGLAAHAGPVDLSSGTGGFIGRPGAGAFSDSYTFTVASTTTMNMLLGSAGGGDRQLDLSSIVLTGPSGTVQAAAYTSGTFSSYAISNAVLTPGAYTLTASGTNSAALAAYAGTIALSGSSTGGAASGGSAPLDISAGSAGFFSTPAAGAFSNEFTFSLATARAVNLMLGSAVGGSQNLDFTSVILRGPLGELIATTLRPDPFEIWSLSTPLLGAGRYSIVASGINNDAMASFFGSLALVDGDTPSAGNGVPEPGSDALVMAGLGAALVAVRRRRGA